MMQPAEDDEVFVYMGGNQFVPHVRRARIHKSVKIISARAFQYRTKLRSVEFHDGLERIEKDAFSWCPFLKGSIKLLGVRIIKKGAFNHCACLTDVEFGDKLETIEESAFHSCYSLRSIVMPCVRNIGKWAFSKCGKLTDLELPDGLGRLEEDAFSECRQLERVTMPLKDTSYYAFTQCKNITSVQLAGGIQSTVATLHMESWRNEMNDEINRINQVLPNTDHYLRPVKLEQWMESVIRQLNHYKSEHHEVLKEATTMLELALWKVNLDDNEGVLHEREGARTTREQQKRVRKEISVTSGASIVIKNVLPFLKLLE